MTGRVFLKFHLPFIAYSCGIIVLSSIPNLTTPHIDFLPFDKLAHFAEYAIFAAIAFRSFSSLFGDNPRKAFLFSALFLTLFSLSDEIYQRFVPGRYSDPADFLADIGGSFLVLILLYMRFRRNIRKWSYPGGSFCCMRIGLLLLTIDRFGLYLQWKDLYHVVTSKKGRRILLSFLVPTNSLVNQNSRSIRTVGVINL